MALAESLFESHMKKILVVASSLDGYIAQNSEQVSTAWTSEADKKWFGQISRQIGWLIMGERTYRTIGRPLPGRGIIVLTERTDFEAAEFGTLDPQKPAGVYKAVNLAPAEIIAELAAKGVSQVAIAGGAFVYKSFLEADLVDEMYVTVESVLLGGGVKLGSEGLSPTRWRVEERIDLDAQTQVIHLVDGEKL